MTDADDDTITRPARVRFSCSELVPGVWLRRYLKPPGGWEGETTQIFTVLATDKRGGVLLKEAATGRELLRRRSHLATSAYWEIL
jgi:hypothetical protein